MDSPIRRWIAKNCPELDPEDAYHEWKMWAESKFHDELSGEGNDHEC